MKETPVKIWNCSRYRNRMEFKVQTGDVIEVNTKVDIETEWNLKTGV